MTFLDFSKAYDSTLHSSMYSILKAYGMQPNILGAIKATYNSLRAKVVWPDGDTDCFKITAGDTLALFLFVIVLDYALRKAIDGCELELGLTLIERRGRRYPPVYICGLNFTDDFVLFFNEIQQAKQLRHWVKTKCGKVDLSHNVKKTRGNKVEQALTESKEQDFKDSEQVGNVQTQKAQSWKVLNKLEKLWTSDLPGW